MTGLYLHVPFCQAICSYCNFNRGLHDAALEGRYVAALEAEIRSGGGSEAVDTVFFGGGTPSLLDPADIRRILTACRETFAFAASTEVTLETNPETATDDRLSAFREAGVNRISFGVQSFDDGELERLGRIHSAERASDAVRTARRAGFDNLSFDLMFWLPGQSMASWLRTVDAAIELAPDHLSLYLLELYPNAPLREAIARQGARPDSGWSQTPDDEAADMYLAALDRLDEAGYRQYEISNVARAGRACRHNLKYWQAGDWLGVGCGAHSTVEGRRWQNVASTTEYVDRLESGGSVVTGLRVLSPDERVEEALFTGLRLTDGVDGRNFAARFGVDPWMRYGDALSPCVDEGLMWRREAAFGLTRQGMLVANEIMQVFV